MYSNLGRDAYPPQLLDDYLQIALRREGALPVTALRTRSLAARLLLAHAVAGTSVSLAQLLVAARRRRMHSLPSEQVDVRALADLARVVALQDLLPEDLSDGLALYDLALEMSGPDSIPPLHQGLHAQLAFHLGDRAKASALLAAYQRVPEFAAKDLRVDLANPFVGASGRPADEWLCRFQSLLPEPHPLLTEGEARTPFDRLTAPASPTVDGPRVSVIVTTYQPGPELLTAVRSLAEQTWTNLEIIVVDDGSPAEHEVALKQCLALDERVSLVKLSTNSGTYVARNAGLDAATSEFVTFQDADDWSHPRRVEHQVRPLLETASLVATATDGLRVTDDLVLTRPGRPQRLLNTSSLMVRKEPVLQRIGYFDQVRKAADSEFYKRIEVVFGSGCLLRERTHVYALLRLSPDSLSRTDFRSGWMHPARAAYKSAYFLWHEQIGAGKASPFLARESANRPFAAARHLRSRPDNSTKPASYDVVLAGDWRKLGGPQKSMLEEIRALTGQGLRVAVAQMEAFRFMTTREQGLCRPVQQLINDGAVDQVLLGEDVRVSLLVIRYPPVLQFAAAEPSRVRARRVVILGNQAPREHDGTDYRYVPQTCTDIVRAMFSVDPIWCPQGPEVRDFLEAALEPASIAPFNLPGIVDADEWKVDRRRFRKRSPVIGRHARDHWTKWPMDREALLAVYPDSPDVDVRIMGGGRTARTLLGRGALPPNWVVYEYDEVSVRSFLNQLDFYVHSPHPVMAEAFGRAILEALATGCVTILPPRFARTFGDAAIYCEPDEVQSVVRRHHADGGLYRAQSERARARVREWFSPETYLDRISTLLAP